MGIRQELDRLRSQLGASERGECPGEIQRIEILGWPAGEPEPPASAAPLCSRCGKRHWAEEQGVTQIAAVEPAPQEV